ncbi:MAG TPA: HIT domain-containing protein [Candidatus Angelobacter sp.]|nr:HIT domain-containing protein [Candidatus Angelobacter sp.]
MSCCLFCKIYEVPGSVVEETVLAESEYFYVKPALGHFVDGYVLIISKDHYRTFSEMPPAALQDLAVFKHSLSSLLSSIYKMPTIAFEHGAACPANRAGSCIDHAHLHLMPTSARINLEKFRFTRMELNSVVHLSEMENNQAYLFYEDEFNTNCFLIDAVLPSQFMRQQLAQALKLGDVWDWRTQQFHDRIYKFVEHFFSMAQTRKLA